MSVDMSAKTKVEMSVILGVQSALTTAGWANTDKWVKKGYLDPETTRPPAVSVVCPYVTESMFEVGNSLLVGSYEFQFEVYGNDDTAASAIAGAIVQGMDGMAIIDFNIALPGVLGYDADAQTEAHSVLVGQPVTTVRNALQTILGVICVIRTDKPIS